MVRCNKADKCNKACAMKERVDGGHGKPHRISKSCKRTTLCGGICVKIKLSRLTGGKE